ncbi:MAG: tetratricopeptide repeat protein [Crocinitomicaceae bacterium]
MKEFFQNIDQKIFAQRSLLKVSIKETYDGYVNDLIDKAIDSWEIGQLDMALIYCEEFLEFEPDSVNGIILYSGFLYMNKDFEASKELLNRIGQEERENAEMLFHFLVGVDLLFNEQFQDSIKRMNQALDVDNRFYIAYLHRAYCYSKLGMHRLAIPDYKKAFKSQYNIYEIKANLAYSYLRNRSYFKALRLHKEIVGYFPDNVKVILNTATIHLIFRKYKRALYYLDKCVELDSNLDIVYVLRGLVHYKKKNKAKAIEDWLYAQQLGSVAANKLLYRYAHNYFPFDQS